MSVLIIAEHNNQHLNPATLHAVVHTIGKALLFDKSLSAGYARKWSSVKQAKAFLSKFSIKE